MKNGVAKYEHKDKVWLIENHKAVEKTVERAMITLTDKQEVIYYLNDKKGSCDYKSIEEKHIYSSREILIKSL